MKGIFIVDWILIMLFLTVLTMRIIKFPLLNLFQLAFTFFLIIHVIQHWKVLKLSLKFKKKIKTEKK